MNQPAKTILIVEDSIDVGLLLQKALKLEGYSVLLAKDGDEALRLFDLDPCPDLILLDLSMPNMDGSEFMRYLRANSKCSHVKVVVVSAWDDLAERSKAIGANGYIRKPVDFDSLHREVNRLLNL